MPRTRNEAEFFGLYEPVQEFIKTDPIFQPIVLLETVNVKILQDLIKEHQKDLEEARAAEKSAKTDKAAKQRGNDFPFLASASSLADSRPSSSTESIHSNLAKCLRNGCERRSRGDSSFCSKSCCEEHSKIMVAQAIKSSKVAQKATEQGRSSVMGTNNLASTLRVASPKKRVKRASNESEKTKPSTGEPSVPPLKLKIRKPDSSSAESTATTSRPTSLLKLHKLSSTPPSKIVKRPSPKPPVQLSPKKRIVEVIDLDEDVGGESGPQQIVPEKAAINTNSNIQASQKSLPVPKPAPASLPKPSATEVTKKPTALPTTKGVFVPRKPPDLAKAPVKLLPLIKSPSLKSPLNKAKIFAEAKSSPAMNKTEVKDKTPPDGSGPRSILKHSGNGPPVLSTSARSVSPTAPVEATTFLPNVELEAISAKPSVRRRLSAAAPPSTSSRLAAISAEMSKAAEPPVSKPNIAVPLPVPGPYFVNESSNPEEVTDHSMHTSIVIGCVECMSQFERNILGLTNNPLPSIPVPVFQPRSVSKPCVASPPPLPPRPTEQQHLVYSPPPDYFGDEQDSPEYATPPQGITPAVEMASSNMAMGAPSLFGTDPPTSTEGSSPRSLLSSRQSQLATPSDSWKGGIISKNNTMPFQVSGFVISKLSAGNYYEAFLPHLPSNLQQGGIVDNMKEFFSYFKRIRHNNLLHVMVMAVSPVYKDNDCAEYKAGRSYIEQNRAIVIRVAKDDNYFKNIYVAFAGDELVHRISSEMKFFDSNRITPSQLLCIIVCRPRQDLASTDIVPVSSRSNVVAASNEQPILSRSEPYIPQLQATQNFMKNTTNINIQVICPPGSGSASFLPSLHSAGNLQAEATSRLADDLAEIERRLRRLEAAQSTAEMSEEMNSLSEYISEDGLRETAIQAHPELNARIFAAISRAQQKSLEQVRQHQETIAKKVEPPSLAERLSSAGELIVKSAQATKMMEIYEKYCYPRSKKVESAAEIKLPSQVSNYSEESSMMQEESQPGWPDQPQSSNSMQESAYVSTRSTPYGSAGPTTPTDMPKTLPKMPAGYPTLRDNYEEDHYSFQDIVKDCPPPEKKRRWRGGDDGAAEVCPPASVSAQENRILSPTGQTATRDDDDGFVWPMEHPSENPVSKPETARRGEDFGRSRDASRKNNRQTVTDSGRDTGRSRIDRSRSPVHSSANRRNSPDWPMGSQPDTNNAPVQQRELLREGGSCQKPAPRQPESENLPRSNDKPRRNESAPRNESLRPVSEATEEWPWMKDDRSESVAAISTAGNKSTNDVQQAEPIRDRKSQSSSSSYPSQETERPKDKWQWASRQRTPPPPPRTNPLSRANAASCSPEPSSASEWPWLAEQAALPTKDVPIGIRPSQTGDVRNRVNYRQKLHYDRSRSPPPPPPRVDKDKVKEVHNMPPVESIQEKRSTSEKALTIQLTPAPSNDSVEVPSNAKCNKVENIQIVEAAIEEQRSSSVKAVPIQSTCAPSSKNVESALHLKVASEKHLAKTKDTEFNEVSARKLEQIQPVLVSSETEADLERAIPVRKRVIVSLTASKPSIPAQRDRQDPDTRRIEKKETGSHIRHARESSDVRVPSGRHRHESASRSPTFSHSSTHSHKREVSSKKDCRAGASDLRSLVPKRRSRSPRKRYEQDNGRRGLDELPKSAHRNQSGLTKTIVNDRAKPESASKNGGRHQLSSMRLVSEDNWAANRTKRRQIRHRMSDKLYRALKKASESDSESHEDFMTRRQRDRHRRRRANITLRPRPKNIHLPLWSAESSNDSDMIEKKRECKKALKKSTQQSKLSELWEMVKS